MADADTRWIKIDDYLERTVATDAAELNHIRQAQEDGGLPDIAVSATQGKFLYLLATIAEARRVLEIGTLGGYSTAWLAKAVGPEGAVVTLEFDPKHAAVAQASLVEAGLGDRVQVLVGAALESLPAVEGPFDLVFIDADKSNNPSYLDWALRLTEPGAVIVVDNVIRWIAEEGPNAEGTRAALERLGSDPRLDATALQTVGVKGWDGLAIAVVR
ncbi:O-methyltransferase [Mycobacteroides abscessus]|uniref:O-methyltransferase n=1 Tax=Mycobacteroides abscessus subsp. massiliense TaxID=1962118 RepID=A0A1T6BX12_9MYCO|nr:O-methyltransferase [Mycobacteroides abscessus]AMU67732.1 methyltransferase [Mycobacteroides abscessus]ANO16270.1 methyltransferase [Mycobacteroides abscessus]ARQ66603.1 methyltransferase [Mycobacteroides abscessus subsp. massiliense]EHM14419.1 O-methyltransferase [Mycobacteroides abscessus subsp. massiliense CCUG 48898 = JCM 15300]EIV65723.1 O-methyltransferase [Mycobacteroides abscessus subsp. massiliense CCUG 48898 = JCM 15300]